MVEEEPKINVRVDGSDPFRRIVPLEERLSIVAELLTEPLIVTVFEIVPSERVGLETAPCNVTGCVIAPRRLRLPDVVPETLNDFATPFDIFTLAVRFPAIETPVPAEPIAEALSEPAKSPFVVVMVCTCPLPPLYLASMVALMDGALIRSMPFLLRIVAADPPVAPTDTNHLSNSGVVNGQAHSDRSSSGVNARHAWAPAASRSS